MRLDLERTILRLLDAHRIMTLATVRPDGWPHATTVGYVSDGLSIYFLCGKGSQKAANIAQDNRVSLTIDHDTHRPMEIEGLSMAARATRVTDPAEMARLLGKVAEKFPEYAELPTPDVEDIRVFRLDPRIISVLNYRNGFGHTDLIVVSPADMVPGDSDEGFEIYDMVPDNNWNATAPWPSRADDD